MANRVFVKQSKFTNTSSASSGFEDDGRLAWRIVVGRGGAIGYVAIPFARRCDAERGLEALKRLMTFDGSYEEIRARIADIGAERIRQAVCEAMAW